MMHGSRVGVCTASPSYLTAAAGLPLSAVLASDVRGAVAVIPGSGNWWQGLLAARDQGAAAVVIADPKMLPGESLDARSWQGPAADIPVVVERPRLRPDLVSDSVGARRGRPARIITVECAAPVAGLDEVIRDGVGWVRSLAQGPVALVAGRSTAQGRMALLDAAAAEGGSRPATLLGTVLSGPDGGGLLQVLALGEVRTELVLDEPAGLVRLETSTADGTMRAPQRYESSPRLALRRAIEALSLGESVADLEELMEDMSLARELLGIPQGGGDVESRQSFVALRPKSRYARKWRRGSPGTRSPS